MNRYLFFLLLPLFVFSACTNPADSDDDDPLLPSFDRRGMLTDWVDEVILPAHRTFAGDLAALSAANDTFRAAPEASNLLALQNSFTTAYLSFQALDPFILGQGEVIRFRERANTYPTDEEQIMDNIGATDINFELPSTTAAQGFPAMEYLLYVTPEALTTDLAYQAYFTRLIELLQSLNAQNLTDWENGSREVYIQNDGNSATASIDRTVNDFIFYYERFLRAGKVGIPAGIFSDDPLPGRAEARHAGYSKALLVEAVRTTRDFIAEDGLKRYLDALDVQRDGELLSNTILSQFESILAVADDQMDNFESQVIADNTSMLRLYDEMQKMVVLLKVDMLQALSINVDYVDADGD